MGGDVFSAVKVDQMCQNVARGGWQKLGIDVCVDALGQFCRGGGTIGQRSQNLAFPSQAMGQDIINDPLGLLNRLPVTGVEDAVPPALQPAQGCHESRQVAVWWRHQRRGPAHDVIAGKQHLAVGPFKAQVVGQMTRRVERAQTETVACDPGAIGQMFIRGKVRINPLCPAQIALLREALHDRAASAGGRAKRHHRRPNHAGKGMRQWTVIQMAVGDQNRAHRAACDGIQQGLHVLRIGGAGIDDRKIAVAHQIALRAGKGHRTGIGRSNHANTRLQLQELSGLRGMVQRKR